MWLEQEQRKLLGRPPSAAAATCGPLGLVSVRSRNAHGPWGHVIATRTITEASVIDGYNIGYLFPLYVRG